MHDKVADWIREIVTRRSRVLGVALCQRAKFEGWLKFELAERALSEGALVEFEPALPVGGRADLAVLRNGVSTFIELKTANFNWRVPGIENKTRPVTMNVAGIIEDARKLRAVGGVIAAIFFPIPKGDERWRRYVQRIEDEAQLTLFDTNCAVVVDLPACPADVLLLTATVEGGS